MISLKQLTYALAVGRTLHFKKAADQCHISQSALSTALAELERHLGFQVFERDNKKVLITPLGSEVLEHARRITAQIDQLEGLKEAQAQPLNYPLSIGIIPTIAPYLLPSILPRLKHQYPHFKPTLIEDQSAAVVDMVKRGDIDTAIIALPYACEGLLSLEFGQEDFFWVTLNDHAESERKEIHSRELVNHDLMLLKDGHCLKDHVLDVCHLPKQSANHGFGATSLTTLIQMVINGVGTTLIPAMAINALTANYPQLSCVHLKERSPHRRLAFVIRPNYTRMNSIEALREVCRAAMDECLSLPDGHL